MTMVVDCGNMTSISDKAYASGSNSVASFALDLQPHHPQLVTLLPSGRALKTFIEYPRNPRYLATSI